ncbi:type II toxin-antitoxin system death-on-curing family toxin [Pontibacillus yanchengensis]|uniref:Type II toxin-antitoxin system death-on-curing family toxin n=3 Tax=Pontibacillus yanchengensis TaxID=462910 RepID=A0ACC7VLK6_9BACI|nr:type II toxin-antitoxin system death-on-curing family toxin [Pontibacillus yanchengensis]MYL55868.1 type II toxin-antitoxin system death-on-curing family toxin [Pontibacillus yanchengensis]
MAINSYVIQRTSAGEFIGVKEPTLLDSAVHRPQQSVLGNDAYPTIPGKASALLESLAQNHCFHNANKRTAFLSMLQFLAYNSAGFGMDQKTAEDFVVDIVNKKYTFEDIVEIVRENVT